MTLYIRERTPARMTFAPVYLRRKLRRGGCRRARLLTANCCPSCRVRDLEEERRIAYVGARPRSSRPQVAAERDNVRPGRTVALQFAHPHLGHESKYAPIITRQRKEPCP
jgi:hypothetical protein